MPECREVMRLRGDKALPRSCPVHGIQKCPPREQPQEEAPPAPRVELQDQIKCWFSVLFLEVGQDGLAVRQVPCATDDRDHLFSEYALNQVKHDSGIPLDAVLLNVTYLGIGTGRDFFKPFDPAQS